MLEPICQLRGCWDTLAPRVLFGSPGMVTVGILAGLIMVDSRLCYARPQSSAVSSHPQKFLGAGSWSHHTVLSRALLLLPPVLVLVAGVHLGPVELSLLLCITSGFPWVSSLHFSPFISRCVIRLRRSSPP